MNTLQLINKYFKIIALAIIVLLVLFSLRQCSKTNDLARENAQLKQSESILSNNLKVSNATMKYWKDKSGNSLSQIIVLSATSEMLKNQYAEVNAKYKNLVGKDAKSSNMIAYLNAQITAKDQVIADLKNGSPGNGSFILNDSTVAIDIDKNYDSVNYYKVNGTVTTSIKNNKIIAGNIDLTTSIGIGLDLAISRDKKTNIANITSRTAFPAKVRLGGITRIEQELNKKPSQYLGLAFVIGYGATIEKQPQLMPYAGLAISLSPRWLTIKINNK